MPSNPILNAHERPKDGCTRCGECCLAGGPALHREDLPRLAPNGPIEHAHIVTLRAGEVAWDQPRQRLAPLEQEMLKIKGRGGSWACRFYASESGGCAIYEERPEECRVLFCREPGPLTEMYDKGRLTRADLLPAGHPVLELLAEHDRRCPPARMAEAAELTGADLEHMAPKLAAMVDFDERLRQRLTDEAGIDPAHLDFLLGRPAKALLAALGLRLSGEGDTARLSRVDRTDAT